MFDLKIKSLAINDTDASHRIVGSWGTGSGILGYHSRDTVGAALSEALDKIPSANLYVEPHNANLMGKVMRSTDVEWIVNDIGEIGVKIGDQFFFCYKGESLMYSGEPDPNGPTKYRVVGKREVGETLALSESEIDSGDFLKKGNWRPINLNTAWLNIAFINAGD